MTLRGSSIAILAASLASGAALAEGAGDEKPADGAGADRPKGHVRTFYGLRKMEHDTSVSDEEKLREWEAYIVRVQEHIKYAEQAVERWKKAAQMRVIDSVKAADHDPKLRPSEKMERWQRVLELYPRSKEARLAKKRIAFWRNVETKLLVEAAEDVERERKSKVERIKAWSKVAEWVERGPEARAAQKRIDALRDQLFTEAKSLDKIARVDAATKLASWRDVLDGRPTEQQRKTAERRIQELSDGPRAERPQPVRR